MFYQKGVLLVLATAVISGLAIFLNQFAVQAFSSDIYTFLKNLVAGFLVAGVLLLMGEGQAVKGLSFKDWRVLTLIGLIGGSLPFILFFKGLSMSSAANGALIHKLMFLFVAVLAVKFLKERLDKKLLAGMLLLVIGQIMIFKFNFEVFLGAGDLLILAATLLWAVESIMAKKALATISSRVVAAARLLCGCFFILLYLAWSGQMGLIGSLNISQFSWVSLTGVLLAGYVLTWYAGLKYLNVSTAASLLTLGLPVTAALQWLQGQPLTSNQGWGFLAIVLGCSLVLFSFKRRRAVYESV